MEMATLDTRTAAKYLGVSPAWLDKARSIGGSPRYIKIGSRIVYRKADLDDFLERHARESTSDANSTFRRGV